jgi:PAS domain S-box-containing protein
MGKDKLELYTLNRHLENRIEERTTDLKAEIKVRKKTETELQQSKKFLGSVFNAIQDGISVLDRDLNIVQVNEVMYQWYPHLETAIGEKCYKVYHGRTQPCAVCPALRSLKTRKMERDEVPYTINDGIIGTQELFSFPMVDPAGKVKGVVEYVRDISERKRIEEQVKAEKRFSESLIKSLPGIMYIFDQSGRFLRWNKNLEDVSGYSSEQIGCMSPFDFIAMEDRILVKKSIEKVFQGGRVNVEAGFQTARGDVIPYLFTGYRFDQESANYLVGVGLDISVRVKVEQEKEALIQELQGTLSQIKQLSGLLPICASCKKIRDDKGYWNQIESYIKKHSEAKFSHGICPECARRLYPDLKLWNSIDSE